MTEPIKITESRFNNDIAGWMRTAKQRQVIVVDAQGQTKIVIGHSDEIHLKDDGELDKMFENLPEPTGDVDTTHNPWLD